MDAVTKQTADRMTASRCLIIKIGSALLVDDTTGEIRTDWLIGLGADIARLKARGVDVVIVSSGAIAVGRTHLGLKAGALALEQKQAAAAPLRRRADHPTPPAAAPPSRAGRVQSVIPSIMSSSADSLETASASTATPRGEPDPAAAVAEALLPERAVTEVRGLSGGGCGRRLMPW